MRTIRHFLLVSSFIAGASLLAQTPCTWVEQPGQIVQTCGNVGIGTTAPVNELHVRDTTGPATIRIEGAPESGVRIIGDRDWKIGNNVGAVGTGKFDIYDVTASAARLVVDTSGNIGIGTAAPGAKLHVLGNIIASGSITGGTVLGAVYQDLAEWVPATSDMTPGTVVVLNPDKNNEVMPSAQEYDERVAGVVSAQPGVILGIGGDSKEMIATTGRVKVKVDATRTPIRVGDLLVSGSKPGVAMRSVPFEINGRRFHQPGTIIGKALEPLPSGEGEILVLLSLQ